LADTPITAVQEFLEHADLEILRRYNARISAKFNSAKIMAENMAKRIQQHSILLADSMAATVQV
jgi:hypothetical protein